MNNSRIKHAQHSKRLGSFLYLSTPIVTDIIKQILQSTDCEVKQKGEGLEIIFCIKQGEKDIQEGDPLPEGGVRVAPEADGARRGQRCLPPPDRWRARPRLR